MEKNRSFISVQRLKVKMGGKRLEFPKRKKYIPPENKLGPYVEEKKEGPKQEDLQDFWELVQKRKGKKKD